MAIHLDTLVLDGEGRWVDEFNWSAIVSHVDRTLQGKLIVSESVIPSEKGRPITLEGDDFWITRNDLITLYDWAQQPDKQMTLTLNDGRVYIVQFRHWESPVLEVSPVQDTAYPDGNTQYRLKMRLAIV